MFSGISSVNFAQSSFISVPEAESERTGKENSPQELKFQCFDRIMISVSNFRSNFRN